MLIILSNEAEFDYIRDRLDVKIEYYKNQSNIAKRRDNIYRLTQILSASLATAITSQSFMFNSKSLSIITSILCVLIVLAQSINAYKKHAENHIRYKITYEKLLVQKVFYVEKVRPYNNSNTSKKTLILRVEKIIDEENNNWQTMQNETKKDTIISTNDTH